MDPVFANAYSVELLYETLPGIPKRALLEALQRRTGGAEPLDRNPEAGLLSFVFPAYPIQYRDGSMPAQGLVTHSDKPVDPSRFEAALQQTWDFDGAEDAVRQARGAVLVTDFMASGLDHRSRLALFHHLLGAVLEVVPAPLGIHWVHAQRIVSVEAYRSSKYGPQTDAIFPAVNVRMFNVSDRSPGETVMDTVGLGALGVPDLQCHFAGLEPTDVARVLYNTAYYLFQQGDVIQDGETVAGVRPHDRWVCQHEDALVPPERVVLDLDPGRPFAAGR